MWILLKKVNSLLCEVLRTFNSKSLNNYNLLKVLHILDYIQPRLEKLQVGMEDDSFLRQVEQDIEDVGQEALKGLKDTYDLWLSSDRVYSRAELPEFLYFIDRLEAHGIGSMDKGDLMGDIQVEDIPYIFWKRLAEQDMMNHIKLSFKIRVENEQVFLDLATPANVTEYTKAAYDEALRKMRLKSNDKGAPIYESILEFLTTFDYLKLKKDNPRNAFVVHFVTYMLEQLIILVTRDFLQGDKKIVKDLAGYKKPELHSRNSYTRVMAGYLKFILGEQQAEEALLSLMQRVNLALDVVHQSGDMAEHFDLTRNDMDRLSNLDLPASPTYEQLVGIYRNWQSVGYLQ